MMTPPILKNFDAVVESRKWREATSRKLDAMTLQERQAYLLAATEKFYAEVEARRKKAALAVH